MLNDRDIGRTPATVEFTWYGHYDVIYRMDGFEPVLTNVHIDPPLYQRFPIDLFAELVWPWEVLDHHETPTITLVEAQPVDENALIDRARALRDRTILIHTPPDDRATEAAPPQTN